VAQTGEPALKYWHRAPLVYLLYEKKTFHCQLCSTRYTAVQTNNCLKRTSAIKEATMKITNDFR